MSLWYNPTTTSPLSLLPSSSAIAITIHNNIHRVSFSRIMYPALTYSSTTLFFVKSFHFNVQVVAEEDKPEDKLINRLRREVLRAGILQEAKRRRFFENPQDKVKRKAREASRRKLKWKPFFRVPIQNKYDSPNDKKDDGEEEDNWEVLDVDIPYTRTQMQKQIEINEIFE